MEEEDYESNNYLYQCLIKKIDIAFENLEIDYNFKFMKQSLNMIKKFIDTLYLEFSLGKSIINIQIDEEEKENDLNVVKDEGSLSLEKIESIENLSSKSDIPKVQSIDKIDMHELNIQFSHSSNKAIVKHNYDLKEEKKDKKIINFSFRYIDFNNSEIEIKNYSVPVWIKKIYIEEGNKLDYISLSIISKINGINSVDYISKEVKYLDLDFQRVC